MNCKKFDKNWSPNDRTLFKKNLDIGGSISKLQSNQKHFQIALYCITTYDSYWLFQFF